MAKRKSRKLRVIKPREVKPRNSIRGRKMVDVAAALFSKYQFGDKLSADDLTELLTENGRAKPENRQSHLDWLASERQHLNDLGRNLPLLVGLVPEKVQRAGFQLTAFSMGKEFIYLVNTIEMDLAVRNRSQEALNKIEHVFEDFRRALPFVSDEDHARKVKTSMRHHRDIAGMLMQDAANQLGQIKRLTDDQVKDALTKRIAEKE